MAIATVINAAGRAVPTEINGKPAIPFMGVGKHRPYGNKYGPPFLPVLIFRTMATRW